ncbi:MAG: hypothetical protein ACK559_09920, partial [bacterium]
MPEGEQEVRGGVHRRGDHRGARRQRGDLPQHLAAAVVHAERVDRAGGAAGVRHPERDHDAPLRVGHAATEQLELRVGERYGARLPADRRAFEAREGER